MAEQKKEADKVCPCGSETAGQDQIPDCCRHLSRERSEKEYKDLLNRLSRIEGQLRGIRRMLENNVYCIDIITQVSAVNSALNSFNKVLLANHKIEELVKVLPRLMK